MTETDPAAVLPPVPRILLVDDRPENLLALRAVLEPLHFELVEASSGEEALRRLLVEEYALIVLDVQMPVLDGFETARLIKGRERTRFVPIIFLTAISGGPEHYLRGYESGAVDYVYKPFEPEVLRAKVTVFGDLWLRGATIERQRVELAARLAQLDEAHAALARQATELERSNAELERMAEVASDEVREPLHTVAGLLDLLAERHLGALSEEGALLVERAVAGTERARAVVSELMALARAGGGELVRAPVPLAEVVAEAEAQLRPVLEKSEVALTTGSLPAVAGDHRMLVELVVHVTEHVLGHTPRGGRISVQSDPGSDARVVRLRVAGSGSTVDAAQLATLFTVWGADLGLTVGRRIAERHGGRIWAEATPGGGMTIGFELPAAEADFVG